MRSQLRSRPGLEPLQRSTLRLLVTGGTGVLGRALQPLAEDAGHQLAMPGVDHEPVAVCRRGVADRPEPLRVPQTPSLDELAALGVARVSWATLLHREAMAGFEEELASLQE